jgi:recombination protein RecT
MSEEKTTKIVVKAYSTLLKMDDLLSKIVPDEMCPNRLIRLFYSELAKNPKLNECTTKSICGSIMSCAQLGLEPGMAGMVYLVPRAGEMTLMLGYKGMIELSFRSDRVIAIEATCIYEKDEFTIKRGTSPEIEHIPYILGDRGRFIGAYAIVMMKNNYKQFEFISAHEIQHIRTITKTFNSTAWINYFDEMAKKTVIRRLLKLIPSSIACQRAIALDEQQEMGIQDMSNVIDGTSEPENNVVDISQSQSDKLADKLAGMGE